MVHNDFFSKNEYSKELVNEMENLRRNHVTSQFQIEKINNKTPRK